MRRIITISQISTRNPIELGHETGASPEGPAHCQPKYRIQLAQGSLQMTLEVRSVFPQFSDLMRRCGSASAQAGDGQGQLHVAQCGLRMRVPIMTQRLLQPRAMDSPAEAT